VGVGPTVKKRYTAHRIAMSITQPATMITDYVLAAAGFVFGVLLLRARSTKTQCLWSIGLLTAGAAAAFGGTYHGFTLYFSEPLRRTLWNTTAGLIGASAGFMISAAIIGGGEKRWLKAGLWISIAGLIIQQAKLAPHPDFNHNDLYHCVQAAALYCFYRGSRTSTRPFPRP
jgi:hypothetical protein